MVEREQARWPWLWFKALKAYNSSYESLEVMTVSKEKSRAKGYI